MRRGIDSPSRWSGTSPHRTSGGRPFGLSDRADREALGLRAPLGAHRPLPRQADLRSGRAVARPPVPQRQGRVLVHPGGSGASSSSSPGSHHRVRGGRAWCRPISGPGTVHRITADRRLWFRRPRCSCSEALPRHCRSSAACSISCSSAACRPRSRCRCSDDLLGGRPGCSWPRPPRRERAVRPHTRARPRRAVGAHRARAPPCWSPAPASGRLARVEAGPASRGGSGRERGRPPADAGRAGRVRRVRPEHHADERPQQIDRTRYPNSPRSQTTRPGTATPRR